MQKLMVSISNDIVRHRLAGQMSETPFVSQKARRQNFTRFNLIPMKPTLPTSRASVSNQEAQTSQQFRACISALPATRGTAAILILASEAFPLGVCHPPPRLGTTTAQRMAHLSGPACPPRAAVVESRLLALFIRTSSRQSGQFAWRHLSTRTFAMASSMCLHHLQSLAVRVVLVEAVICPSPLSTSDGRDTSLMRMEWILSKDFKGGHFWLRVMIFGLDDAAGTSTISAIAKRSLERCYYYVLYIRHFYEVNETYFYDSLFTAHRFDVDRKRDAYILSSQCRRAHSSLRLEDLESKQYDESCLETNRCSNSRLSVFLTGTPTTSRTAKNASIPSLTIRTLVATRYRSELGAHHGERSGAHPQWRFDHIQYCRSLFRFW